MFKKAKYRWQIKSSNRSNQLMGLEDGDESPLYEDSDSPKDPPELNECLENNNDLQINESQKFETTEETDFRENAEGNEALMEYKDSGDESVVNVAHTLGSGDYNSNYSTSPLVVLNPCTANAISDSVMCDMESASLSEMDGSHTHYPVDDNLVEPTPEQGINNEMHFEAINIENRKRPFTPDSDDSNLSCDDKSFGVNVKRARSEGACLDSSENITHDVPPMDHSDSEERTNQILADHSPSFETSNGEGFTSLRGRHDGTLGRLGDPPSSPEHDRQPISNQGLTNTLDSLLNPKAIDDASANTSQSQPRRLTYLERWRCQHLAKAMVDNAINKTLEESGLSPNPSAVPNDDNAQSNLETEGVSHAIRMVGLRPRYSPSSMRRLNPILNRLTQVSENIFSANLRNRQRNRAMENAQSAAGDRSQNTMSAYTYQREGNSPSHESDAVSHRGPTLSFQPQRGEETHRPSVPPMTCDHDRANIDANNQCYQCLNNYPKQYPPQLAPLQFDPPSYLQNMMLPPVDNMGEQNNASHGGDTFDPGEMTETFGATNKAANEEDTDTASSINNMIMQEPNETDTELHNIGQDVENEETSSNDKSCSDSQGNLSTSFLLDTAVSFAINEKGLQLN